MNKWLISVFDYTGNASKPYREAGWDVLQIDIQHGFNFLDFNPIKELNKRSEYGTLPEVGIILMMPCTHDALSGAKHFAYKDANGITAETDLLMEHAKNVIDFFERVGILKFWVLEQPKTRLHKRHPWIQPIIQKFNPCDFAGYDPIPDNSRYNKETWFFGKFNKMKLKRLEPLSKEYPGWRSLGGKSLKTKNARSATPLGLCYAFFESNQ